MTDTQQTLDLDAIAEWFEGKTQQSNLDDLSVVPEWHAVRDLIARVRQAERERDEARAALARVKALESKWAVAVSLMDNKPHLVMRGIAAELRAAIEGP